MAPFGQWPQYSRRVVVSNRLKGCYLLDSVAPVRGGGDEEHIRYVLTLPPRMSDRKCSGDEVITDQTSSLTGASFERAALGSALFGPTNPTGSAYNLLLEARHGNAEVWTSRTPSTLSSAIAALERQEAEKRAAEPM
jgi:hypothetical protein